MNESTAPFDARHPPVIERLNTDFTPWTLGPYHAALPGLLRLKLVMDGEMIVSARTETGFAHRGIEKVFEGQAWTAGISVADRLDAEGAFFGELAFCLAVEKLSGIEVLPRAQVVRTLVSELSRIVSHLGYIARLARSTGAETLFHYVQRDREKFIDLLELLSGARFSLNFLRFGGVATEVSDGFVERVLDVCAMMRHRFKEYNDLFSFNQAFLGRSRGIGRISARAASASGLTGPNARASGLDFDIRKWSPYAAYGSVDFDVMLGADGDGDSHGRYMIRIREIVQSMEIVQQCSEILPTGKSSGLRADDSPHIPSGEAWSRIESARGLLACHVISDGGERPIRVHFRSASRAGLDLLPQLLQGARSEDLPVLLASLDLNLAEIDR